MNNSDQAEQRIKRALKKISKIRKLFLLAELWLRVAVYKIYYTHSRARVHWIGPKRPRRPERIFIIVVLIWAIVLLETEQFKLWSIIWGSLTSFFVIFKSFAMMFQKKSDRWVIRY